MRENLSLSRYVTPTRINGGREQKAPVPPGAAQTGEPSALSHALPPARERASDSEQDRERSIRSPVSFPGHIHKTHPRTRNPSSPQATRESLHQKKQSEIFASRHVTLHDLPINALFQGFPASRPVALEGSKSTKETRRPLFLHDLQRATNYPRAKGELRPDSVSRRQQQPPRPFKSDIKGSSQTQTTTTTNDN